MFVIVVFFFKKKTAYEMRISDWSSDVCSSDLSPENLRLVQHHVRARRRRPGIRIGPAVARGHQPHLDQPEIQHGPRRLADILAKLRADEIGRAACRESGCQYV